MRIIEAPLDPEVAELVDVPEGKFVAIGSDVAVSPTAPVVTGDRVVDTQLENYRGMVCSRVRSIYALVTRLAKVRLWAMESTWDGGRQSKSIAPTLVKRDDHPVIQNIIRLAKRLADLDDINCQRTVMLDGKAHTSLDGRLQLIKVEKQLKIQADLHNAIMDAEKLGSSELDKAQRMVKEFHALAQAWRMHREKIETGSDRSDLELLRIATQVKPEGVTNG